MQDFSYQLPLYFVKCFEQLGQKLASSFHGSELYISTSKAILSFSDGKVTVLPEFRPLPMDYSFPLSLYDHEPGLLYVRPSGNKPNLDHLELIIENFNLKIQLEESRVHAEMEALKQQLLQAETRFKTIFDQFPLSIQILSPDGKTTLVNKSWKNLWKIDEEIIQNFILKDYKILEDPVLKEKGLEDFIKRGISGEVTNVPTIEYDTQEAGLGGISRLVDGLMFPLRDEAGNLKEIILIHTDVTEKETLLSELTLERNRFEAVIRSMPAGVMLVEKNSNAVSLINQQMLNIQGLTVSGPTLQEEEIPRIFYNSILRSIEEGESFSNEELEYRNNLGKVMDISVSTAPVKNASGDVAAAVAVVTDISDKKSGIRRQILLNKLTSILISTLDYDQVITKISEACLPELADGCIIDVVEDNKINRLVTRHTDPEIQSLMEELQRDFPPTMDSPQPAARVIRSGEPELLSFIDQRVISSHTFDQKHSDLIKKIGFKSHIAVPLMIRGKVIGSIGFVISTDRKFYDEADVVTATEVARRATLAIENAQLYLHARKAIQQRDEFISIASHELKTPITSMKLQLQMASRITAKNEDGKIESRYFKKVADMSNKQLDRLTVLVDDMLDITRIASGKLALKVQQNNISELVTELLNTLNDELDPHTSLISAEIQEDVLAYYDSFRIEQVLTNLLNNAIRYGDKKPVKVKLNVEGSEVLIKVTDNGPGIDPKDQERIFERFERAVSYNNISGLGLGLYISRQIMELHKGTLTLESFPGKGSTFIVKFPQGQQG